MMFDNPDYLIHHGSMRRSNLVIACLLLICMPIAAASYGTAAEALQAQPFKPVMPSHSVLGAITDPVSAPHPAIRSVHLAFSGFYGADWYELHVIEGSRSVLSKTYDAFLASALPARTITGSCKESGSQVSVPLWLEGAHGDSVRIDVTLEKDAAGIWRIISFSTR